MVRFISWAVGLAFCGVLALALIFTTYGALTEPAEESAAHDFHLAPKELALASNGPMGKFDRQQLQRGLQIYKEVCSACHSLKLVSFRDLKQIGYSDGQVKTFAAGFTVPSVNPDTGEPATRPGVPADRFPLVYPNDTAAKAANNNAIPPDLSLMTKARHDGPAYVYSLLTGYAEQAGYKNAKGEELLKRFPTAATPAGLHFNPYYATLNFAMPPPLVSDGQVTYAPGQPAATVDQMAKDVSAFLTWTAEPKLEVRHQLGLAVVIFLAIFILLAIGAYRAVWADVKH